MAFLQTKSNKTNSVYSVLSFENVKHPPSSAKCVPEVDLPFPCEAAMPLAATAQLLLRLDSTVADEALGLCGTQVTSIDGKEPGLVNEEPVLAEACVAAVARLRQSTAAHTLWLLCRWDGKLCWLFCSSKR